MDSELDALLQGAGLNKESSSLIEISVREGTIIEIFKDNLEKYKYKNIHCTEYSIPFKRSNKFQF